MTRRSAFLFKYSGVPKVAERRRDLYATVVAELSARVLINRPILARVVTAAGHVESMSEVRGITRCNSIARPSGRTKDMSNLHFMKARVLQFEPACLLQLLVRLPSRASCYSSIGHGRSANANDASLCPDHHRPIPS